MERYYCVICVISCVFTLLGCVYVTVLVGELRDLRAQCACCKEVTDMPRVGDVAVQSDESRILSYENTLNHRLKRMVPDHIEEVKIRHRRKSPAKKQKKSGKKSKVKAGHYVTMVTDDYVNKHIDSYENSKITSDPYSITEPCVNIRELRGTVCRSLDFTVTNPEGILHVYKPASWMSKKLEPFTLKENGEFHAKAKGIYFVYAQVLFYDSHHMQMIVMNKKDQKTGESEHVLSCMRMGLGSDIKGYNTCSMHGLVPLNKKDILTVENVYHDVTINFKPATTYFGAFMLK